MRKKHTLIIHIYHFRLGEEKYTSLLRITHTLMTQNFDNTASSHNCIYSYDIFFSKFKLNLYVKRPFLTCTFL